MLNTNYKEHWGRNQVGHFHAWGDDCHINGSHSDAYFSNLSWISFNSSKAPLLPQQRSTRSQMSWFWFGLDEESLGCSQSSESLYGENCSPVSTCNSIEPTLLLRIGYGKALPHEWASQMGEHHMTTLTWGQICQGCVLETDFFQGYPSWPGGPPDKHHQYYWPGHCTIIKFSVNTRASEKERKCTPCSSDHNRSPVNSGKWEHCIHPKAAEN